MTTRNPDYAFWAKAAARRFDVAAKELKPAAFFAHASIGWDQNPRYPPGKAVPTVLGSTPAVEVEDLVFTGTAGQASLATSGNVSFPAAMTVTIPDEWQSSGDRLVLVDGSSAAGSLPVTARIVTATGTDVTDKAHLFVRNGVASICFASGTVIIMR